MIGKTVEDKYEIRQLIGEGAMGAVYEARHVETDRRVALKVLTHEAAQDDELVDRFEQDVKEAAKLVTPYGVELLDQGRVEPEGHPYVVAELLRGENLRALIERVGRLQPDVAARVGGQVCLGLEKAHAAGLVHRDLKPANVFLIRNDDGERSIKLLDFGVGRLKMDHALTTGNRSLVRGLSMLGSPLYMPPEQAAGADETIDHRADLWSLGIVLYELLAGAPPHKSAESLEELIEAIRSDEPPPLRDEAPWVAPELADAVHRALRLDPADRYASAAEMREALEAYVPSGWRIAEEHLVALTEEQRSPWSPEEDTRRIKLAAEAQAELARSESEPPAARELAALGDDDDESPAEDDAEAASGDDAAAGAEPAPDSEPTDAAEDRSSSAPPSSDGGGAEPRQRRASPTAAATAREGGQEPGGSSGLSRALGVGLVLGIVAIVGYALFGRDGPSAEPTDAAGAPSAIRTVEPRSSAAAGAGGAASSAAADADDAAIRDGGGGADAEPDAAADDTDDGGAALTGRLKIVPPFAVVTVDGEAVQLEQGYVELSGEQDSIHEVVLTVAGKTKTVQVTLTADGPVPPHVVFVLPRPPGAGAPNRPGDGDLYE